MSRVAFCVIGGVGFPNTAWDGRKRLHNMSEFIGNEYRLCHDTVVKNIFNNNKDVNFDVYLHSWDVKSTDTILDVWKPKKYLIEDNEMYRNEIIEHGGNIHFNCVSFTLSIKKCIEMIDEDDYDYLFIWRVDLGLMKPVYMNECDQSIVYVGDHFDSQHGNLAGDFHFIMNYQNALKFKNIFDEMNTLMPNGPHGYFKPYLTDTMNVNIDGNLVPGKDYSIFANIDPSFFRSC